MDEIVKLIIRFLESHKLSPGDYMWVPISKEEIRIQPFEAMDDDKLNEIAQPGIKLGFDIILKEPYPGSPKKELVFLTKQIDPAKIGIAMRNIGTTEEQSSINTEETPKMTQSIGLSSVKFVRKAKK